MKQVLKAKIASFSLGIDGEDNNDALGHKKISDDKLLLAIADGVGSANFGGDAARLAINTCLELADHLDIENIFEEVKRRIRSAAEVQGGEWSTTLTICITDGKEALVGHVGDTRIYHLRGKGILSRTTDQTEVERLIEEGILTRERAITYPRRNVLLSAMSNKTDYTLQLSSFEVKSNDRILLISDGAYRTTSKKEIVRLSIEKYEINEFVDSLKAAITTKGLIDDSSLLCVEL